MKKMLCIGALVGALSAGAFLYRQEEKQHYEMPKEGFTGSEPWDIYVCGEALKIFRDGLGRMKKIGAEYSQKQLAAMLLCADKENNRSREHHLDVKEAKELCDVVLNPDTFLGRIAMSSDKIPGTGYSVPMPEKYRPFLLNLLDANSDGRITKEEVDKALKNVSGR